MRKGGVAHQLGVQQPQREVKAHRGFMGNVDHGAKLARRSVERGNFQGNDMRVLHAERRRGELDAPVPAR
ncbi:Hypothetical protein RG1141_PA08100 (plasmid) [Neorhizobium galegae bv. officinalis bv. officinalis str. HAMBI 1141]|uniref:Uncharacterized protein n=1 Tax=Neorhizobium galegae bv. officinalis bv. officinalis str. HAMBI 1141 TaxID=1028801 RepID=A0A068TGR7_NEOGA|nr:Hypothetical protein RG1141_PA08100 [Neorhizobium galegae bv. officinalis bv. officinalis str. HAMBI 1141]